MEIEKLNTYLMVGLQCPWPVTWAVLSHLNGTPTQKTDCVEWRLNGKLHRIGGPAMEWADGDKLWCELGKLHRIGGPAIERANGDKSWFELGKLHRIGGPAMEWANGSKWWWELDKLHRIGGPAVEWADGSKEWWERGIHVSPPPQNAKSPE